MPLEEVNAWASYEQTAKTARRFSNAQIQPIQPSGVRHRAGRHSIATSGYGVPLLPLEENAFFRDYALEHGKSQAILLDQSEREEKRQKLSGASLEKIRKSFPIFFPDEANRKRQNESSIKSICMLFNATMPWVQRYFKSEVVLFLDMCLRGVGQVYFQNSPLSGLLILAGLFVQSTRVAIHGVIAVIFGTATALALGFDRGLAQSGLFGYNAILVGLAIATFDSQSENAGYSFSTILSTAIFSSFTSIIFVMLGKILVPYKSPPLTLPFNISTILFLLATAKITRFEFDPVRLPALPNYDSDASTNITSAAFFEGIIRGIGQVFLADKFASGCLILFGIAVCSRISGVAAFLGSALGAAIGVATGVPTSQIQSGLYGFNASLSFAAMLMFYNPSLGATTMAIFAAIMTVFGQQAIDTMLQPLGLPFMTLPFCCIALPFIILQGTTSIVIAVPLSSMTIPEDHLRRVKILSDGFTFLKESLSPENASRHSKMHSQKVSKSLRRLSTALDDTTRKEDEEAKTHFGRSSFTLEENKKKAARSIFSSLAEEYCENNLPLSAVTDALQVAGLVDPELLQFAGLILSSLDLDQSNTIEENEFVAFVIVSDAIDAIHKRLTQFLDFVDTDGDGTIDLEEIDGALEYLGETLLSDEEKSRFVELTKSTDCLNGIGADRLVNILTLAKVNIFVKTFHQNQKSD